MKGLYNEVLTNEFGGKYEYYLDTFRAVQNAKSRGVKFDQKPTDDSLNPPYSYYDAKDMTKKIDIIRGRFMSLNK